MKVSKEEFFHASKEAGVKEAQIRVLWEKMKVNTPERKFNFFNVLHYLGAFLIIFSVTRFCWWNPSAINHKTLLVGACVYILFFAGFGFYFWHFKRLSLVGGLFMVIAVAAVPLVLYLVQNILGWWQREMWWITYRDFYHKIQSGWILINLSTIVASLTALYFVRFPFLTAIFYAKTAFLITDLVDYFSEGDLDLVAQALVVLGSIFVAIGFFLDRKGKRDFAFWAYFFGLLSFLPGVIFLSDSELGRVGYGLLSFVLIMFSVVIQRRVFLVFGSLGILTCLSDLIFHCVDSFVFSLLLALIGLSVLLSAIFLQRFRQQMHQFLLSLVPDSVKKWLALPHLQQ